MGDGRDRGAEAQQENKENGPEKAGKKDRVEKMVARLRKEGNRMTPQRVAILHALVDSGSHPNAGEIHRRVLVDFPSISLATVYKTLKLLKQLGEVLEIDVDRCSHYDPVGVPHPHLICIECGSIADLPPHCVTVVKDEVLGRMDFEVMWYDVDVYGLCSRCRSDRARADDRPEKRAVT